MATTKVAAKTAARNSIAIYYKNSVPERLKFLVFSFWFCLGCGRLAIGQPLS
jgi:hypothetical protein